MPRRHRFAPPNHWLHITQRGNDKQRIFLTDADRQHFLDLLEQRSEERQVRIAGYAIMSNHDHLVAKGDKEDAISLFMMDVNGLYATHRNKAHHHTGRVWQGRFYAAVLDLPTSAPPSATSTSTPSAPASSLMPKIIPGPPLAPTSDSPIRPNGSTSKSSTPAGPPPRTGKPASPPSPAAKPQPYAMPPARTARSVPTHSSNNSRSNTPSNSAPSPSPSLANGPRVKMHPTLPWSSTPDPGLE